MVNIHKKLAKVIYYTVKNGIVYLIYKGVHKI